MARARALILVRPGDILVLKKGTGRRTTRRLVRIEDLMSHYRALVVECDSEGRTVGGPSVTSRQDLVPQEFGEGQQRK